MGGARLAGYGLLACLVFWPASAFAQEGGQPERRTVEVRRAVVVDEDGAVHTLGQKESREADRVIWFGDGDGEHHVRFVLEELGLGRGYLGVQLLELTGALRRHFGVDPERGVMVSEVVSGSPAEAAGVEVGDILVAIDDEPISSVGMLVERVRERDPGATAHLRLVRDGASLEVEAEIGEHQRPVIHLSPLRSESPDQLHVRMRRLDGDGRVEVEVDEVVDQIRSVLSDEAVKQRLQRIESLDWRGVARRMEEVERQLRELEARLAELEPAKVPDDG